VLTFLFDATRQILTWGRGKYGQLGHGTAQNGSFPVAVKALAEHRVTQIACGGDHTIAVNSGGQIFSVSFPLACFTL
jgi:alpha-tubulin suppressor-like RCC1 family protein